jgi:hypothetical protein
MLNIIKVQDEVKTVREFSALSQDTNFKLKTRGQRCKFHLKMFNSQARFKFRVQHENPRL